MPPRPKETAHVCVMFVSITTCTRGGRDEGVTHLVESDKVTAHILLERSRHGLVLNEPRAVSEQRTARRET